MAWLQARFSESISAVEALGSKVEDKEILVREAHLGDTDTNTYATELMIFRHGKDWMHLGSFHWLSAVHCFQGWAVAFRHPGPIKYFDGQCCRCCGCDWQLWTISRVASVGLP